MKTLNDTTINAEPCEVVSLIDYITKRFGTENTIYLKHRAMYSLTLDSKVTQNAVLDRLANSLNILINRK